MTLDTQSSILDDGGSGHTTPQNMASWHIEYFKLEFKKQQVQAGFSELSLEADS